VTTSWAQLREYYRDVLDGGSFTPWGDAPTGSMIYMAEPEYLSTDAALSLDGASGIGGSDSGLLGSPVSDMQGGEAFFVGAWVKIPTFRQYSPIIQFGDPGAAGGGWSLAQGNVAANGYRVDVRHADDTAKSNYQGGGPMPTGSWAYVLFWHDGASDEIGIVINNGTPSTHTHSAGVYSSATRNVTIGYGFSGPVRYHEGLIQQIVKVDKVPSSADIAWLYNSGSGRTDAEVRTRFGSDLKGLIPLHEATGAREDTENTGSYAAVNTPSYDTGIITNPAVDRATIKAWEDRLGVGNDFLQATITKQAVYDASSKAVDPDGVDDEYSATLAAKAQPNTYLFVLTDGVIGNGKYLFTGTSPNRNGFWQGSLTQYAVYAGSGQNVALTPDTDPHVFTALFSGASTVVRMDGVAAAAVSPGTEGMGNPHLFRSAGGSLFGRSPMGYWQMVPSTITDDYRDAAEAYLKTYYGVA